MSNITDSSKKTDRPKTVEQSSLNIEGSCHCKKIQYTALIDLNRVRICHCNDCQVTSGSAFRINLPTLKSDFQLVCGELKTYIKIAESGNQRALCFCDNCGTQIYSTAVNDAAEFNLRVGTIKQRQKLVPQSDQWGSEALPWTRDIMDKCRLI
ncbi:GFA family protein [Aliikangiella marina]|uniref:GFA family protein n=1 Tax=Aliikangiella marina TaxID=1712262 RepID=A0A545TCZ7_9GAMM|nr:GFA family protein [Aliikangiella marina]TQV75094.1 GFA family protein [Aliikangiella marina]